MADYKEIIKAFKNFESYEGVSGKITMTEDNKTIIPTAIYELSKSKLICFCSYWLTD